MSPALPAIGILFGVGLSMTVYRVGPDSAPLLITMLVGGALIGIILRRLADGPDH